MPAASVVELARPALRRARRPSSRSRRGAPLRRRAAHGRRRSRRGSQRDLERGATGLGPHLDDVAIRSGDRDLRLFGSQGEQRLAVLSLLLARPSCSAERRGVRRCSCSTTSCPSSTPTAGGRSASGSASSARRSSRRPVRRRCRSSRRSCCAVSPGRRRSGRLMERLGDDARRLLAAAGAPEARPRWRRSCARGRRPSARRSPAAPGRSGSRGTARCTSRPSRRPGRSSSTGFQPELLERLRAGAGRRCAGGAPLRSRPGPRAAGHATSRPGPWTDPRSRPEARLAGRAAAAAISDPELRELVARAAAASLSRPPADRGF